jgi:hypothetical protein
MESGDFFLKFSEIWRLKTQNKSPFYKKNNRQKTSLPAGHRYSAACLKSPSRVLCTLTSFSPKNPPRFVIFRTSDRLTRRKAHLCDRSCDRSSNRKQSQRGGNQFYFFAFFCDQESKKKKTTNKLAVNINFRSLLAAKHSSEEHEEDFSIINSSAESRDLTEVSFVQLLEKKGINPSSRLLVHLFVFVYLSFVLHVSDHGS